MPGETFYTVYQPLVKDQHIRHQVKEERLQAGQIHALFDDVFWIPGKMPCSRTGQQANMIILRDDQQLSLINPVRLSPLQQQKLEQLGEIRHILRLGDRPTTDEHFYRSRYQAELWAVPGQQDKACHNILKEDKHLPVRGTRLLTFNHACRTEAVLLLERHRLLISHESFQYFSDWQELKLMDQLRMKLQGFHRGLNLSRHWLRDITPKGYSLEADLNRLQQLPFDALLASRGVPLLNGAQQAIRLEMDEVYH